MRSNAAWPCFRSADTTYLEVSKIGLHRQRRDLADVIERLSGYRVVTSRVAIAQHEVEALLDNLVGPSPRPINSMHYLDWGVARAFAMMGGFHVNRDDGVDVTDEVRAQHPDGPDAFDMILMKGELDLNRNVLEGPTLEEEPGLRAQGWDPRAAYEVIERRAAQEIEQVAQFNGDPKWRQGRIRDVVSAREIIIEINRYLYEGLADRQATLDDVYNDVENTRRRIDSMPSFDVAVSMKVAYHKDPGINGRSTTSRTSTRWRRRSRTVTLS